ncbi:hypothetical protein L9F63_019534 [Diploptera punctata]|uniref:Uncharacterized protein n=1 Tax=Diploptera punctata TaxID=6984 RepID=A0AAD7ZUB0_DIPPU|nr:hypothetical protein L9F63_019534 [Diploptera punctata]
MSRDSSLHVVGCVSVPQQKQLGSLERFRFGQTPNSDDDSEEVEDETKELRKKNHQRVDDMIQEAKKKLDHKKNPVIQNRNKDMQFEDVDSNQAGTLDVLRKIEKFRNEKDCTDFERKNLIEEKAVQPNKNAVCKKQEDNLEYFTGTKRSKNQKKHKKQERVISLTELDIAHKQKKQEQHTTVDVPIVRPVSCWDQKKGSELFESKNLSDYNCPGTEEELLERAIAESIKTHKAEVERQYTTHR